MAKKVTVKAVKPDVKAKSVAKPVSAYDKGLGKVLRLNSAYILAKSKLEAAKAELEKLRK